MSKIISIGTEIPPFRHRQADILSFMQHIYALDDKERRKLRFMYAQSAIDFRHSVIPDYSRPLPEWKFYPHSENLEPFPSLEQRMSWYVKYAAPLSVDAIRHCIANKIHPKEITHLITASCTGMSAPGLDLQIMELMDLPNDIFRTSLNFMGCYAAIHALNLADSLCKSDKNAKVLVVCTELCTLHFQRDSTADNISSSLLFGDGSAAALITADEHPAKGIRLESFYSEVMKKGRKDMAWELSSTGFQMTLSSYVPDLIEEDFSPLVHRALKKLDLPLPDITHWCVHPGGRKVLEAVQTSLQLPQHSLSQSYEVLRNFGNMSSPTILFILDRIGKSLLSDRPNRIFVAAFGPGLTIETFVARA